MSAPDFAGFLLALSPMLHSEDPRAEILRHEMGATINRNRLTGLEEGINSFSTDQLCWLAMSNPAWSHGHPLVQALVLSAALDSRWDIVVEAERHRLIPDSWTWWGAAVGFPGSAPELLDFIQGQSEWRVRCGIAALATRGRPSLITPDLLLLFARQDLAKCYHQLLLHGLSGAPTQALANAALSHGANCPELFFVGDVDPLLADLVRLGKPENPDAALAPFREAIGDFTRAAAAELDLERGLFRSALQRLNGIRLLSLAYPRSVLVAVLAALESQEFAIVKKHLPHIADLPTRLKVQTRLAQAENDTAGELDALTELHALTPGDGSVFGQLITVLERLGQDEIARHLCFTNQERFLDEPVLMQIIRRHTGG
jgi:hypothetical protein